MYLVTCKIILKRGDICIFTQKIVNINTSLFFQSPLYFSLVCYFPLTAIGIEWTD